MKPILQALLVADHVYVDATTNKKVVAGVFRNLQYRQPQSVVQPDDNKGQVSIKIPPGGMAAGSPFCYIALTDVKGKQQFVLRYVNLADDKALFQTDLEVNCPDPLESVEIVLPLPMLPVPGPGTYALELIWHGEPLGTHRITVKELKD
ncbi:hypothetical protein [Bythopirellula goksoeyrii]|uniref:Uncharacterized protein n=1 Tax=Bythopirellula goksoeyrii TaxID=1400387 RepID=A0A5B9Q8J3_9BACT|nr:hypothetical protein [Bythopirellula goksoeyrii]QEG35394.1 hypothetical protein Pr1d_26920 [Bythopirellula goksoeyrii]